jgi:hypothetical protein
MGKKGKRRSLGKFEGMRDIANDRGLIRRLKQGTLDAKNGRGKFVKNSVSSR